MLTSAAGSADPPAALDDVCAEWASYRYHFDMLHDVDRNHAYHAALQRVVTPESVVLDIGTGSGLLVRSTEPQLGPRDCESG